MSLALREWVIVIPLFPFIYALAVPGRWGKLGLWYVIIPHWQYIKDAYTNICLFQRRCFTPPYNSRSKRFNILLWNHENPPLVCIWIIAFLKTTSVPQWQWLLNCKRELGVRHFFLEAVTSRVTLLKAVCLGTAPNLPQTQKLGWKGGASVSWGGQWFFLPLSGNKNLVWKPPLGGKEKGKVTHLVISS